MKSTMVSVIIPTLGRKSLYPLIESINNQNTNFEFEIVLIPQRKLDNKLLNDKKIKIYPDTLGKGISFYRNKGILKSKGNILVFIDDDELPRNNSWLKNITKKIISNEEKVTTSGVDIKLGQGYFTDSISLLGFPGGGAIGFKTMWKVDNEGYTNHLCSGNFSISKDLILRLGMFSENLKFGNEDVNLGDKIIKRGIKIKYIKKATVYHKSRKGFINFIEWNLERGKSAKIYLAIHNRGGKLTERMKSSIRILSKVTLNRFWYLPGVLFFMFNQYLWQTIGYLYEKK